MIAAGYVASIEEAFDEWIGPGGPAFVPRLGLGPREAIESIREADGLPVLAHSPAAAERGDVVDRLRGWGLAGLEVHYRSFDPETVARLLAFATSRSLLVTGGSDYHGDLVTYAQSQAMLSVPDSVGDALLATVS
jgi:predicted metal-dependent phosphoesterase TrpH